MALQWLICSRGHINFRDSKLTRILRNSLGGNAHTAIVCTVNPCSNEQTLRTLQVKAPMGAQKCDLAASLRISGKPSFRKLWILEIEHGALAYTHNQETVYQQLIAPFRARVAFVLVCILSAVVSCSFFLCALLHKFLHFWNFEFL